MLYKVTPSLAPQPEKETKAPKDPNAPKQPRKRRKSAVYDADGNEVLITMMCLKCRSMKPLTMFGLRKMADGAIRNQPWCRTCRSGASGGKKKEKVAEDAPEVLEAAEQLAAEALSDPGPTPPSERTASLAAPAGDPLSSS